MMLLFSVLHEKEVNHQMIHAHVDCGVDPTVMNNTELGDISCSQAAERLADKDITAALYVTPPPAHIMERG